MLRWVVSSSKKDGLEISIAKYDGRNVLQIENQTSDNTVIMHVICRYLGS